jgi:Fe-S cluster assembly protein SufD
MSTVAEAVVLPSTRHEAWKYTPVDELAAALRSAVRAVPTPLTSAEVDNLAGDLGCPRVVYVNGVYAADLSDHVLPKGLHHHRPLAGTSAFVVEAGVKITTPIHLVHVSAPGGVRSLSQPRTSIDAGEGSDVAAIETYCGRPGLGFTDATTTLHVGPGARLAHIRVQSESPEALRAHLRDGGCGHRALRD